MEGRLPVPVSVGISFYSFVFGRQLGRYANRGGVLQCESICCFFISFVFAPWVLCGLNPATVFEPTLGWRSHPQRLVLHRALREADRPPGAAVAGLLIC